jgi:OOP family OmpA-OmpF porin
MLKQMKSYAPMRAMAAAVLAFAVTSPNAQGPVDDALWYAAGDATVPNGQAWVTSYGECWSSVFGPTNLPPCSIPEEVTVRLNFEFDKFMVPENVVNTEEIAKIDEYIDQLESTPENEVVTVVGHTDAKGSDEYNMALGQRRADAVRDYIIRRGYPEEHVAPAESRGKRDLLPNLDPFSLDQRRVVLTKTDG